MALSGALVQTIPMQIETNLDRLPPSATGSRVRLVKGDPLHVKPKSPGLPNK